MNPKIINHVWHRNVPATWLNASGWRTDCSVRVLFNPEVHFACYHLTGGPTVLIRMAELRLAVHNAPRRMNGKVGPFCIDPFAKIVNGHPISMDAKTAA
jgi:hypothetical protein